jgi:hypothetical protein
MWMVGAVAAAMPWLTQAQDRTFGAPQSLDGIVVSVDFEPAAMAPNWTDSHRSSGVDTAAPAVRPDLDRHLVVTVIDELTRERVGGARIGVTLTRTGPPGSAFIGKLVLLTLGFRASYGTMTTVDP